MDTTRTHFEGLLADALRRAYVAAYRWLGDGPAAQDACQEAAARAWRARERYRTDAPFYPWFYVILRNHCRDVRRGRAGQPLPLAEAADPAPRADAQLIQGERNALLLEAIAGLPEDLREVIELRHFQSASYREMSEIIGIPEGTVMSRLYRARQVLAERVRRAERRQR
jgi:RNA polymerase sigma-70 factor, ECF subfamily